MRFRRFLRVQWRMERVALAFCAVFASAVALVKVALAFSAVFASAVALGAGCACILGSFRECD